jgi:hypothetical protein
MPSAVGLAIWVVLQLVGNRRNVRLDARSTP